MTALARCAALAAALALAACGGGGGGGSASGSTAAVVAPPPPVASVTSTAVTQFASPWSMVFLPDGRLLVTERIYSGVTPGNLWLVTQAGDKQVVSGQPTNIGMLDVILHPQFAANHTIYMSFIEPGGPGEPRVGRDVADLSINPAGLSVATATLSFDAAGNPSLQNVKVIWRQSPKIVTFPGSGEPGGRMTFSPDGRYLFIAAGDRQEFQPVQLLSNTLGKVVRLLADGSVPADNPFVGQAGALPEIWTLGHRNPYGLAFDASGQLWENENGPEGGDELNLIKPGLNYGWPSVSYGNDYSGALYPKPMPGDGFAPAALWWTPAIAPSGMIFYSGSPFGAWNGDAIISALKGMALVRVHVSGETAVEAQRIPMTARIRSIIEGPDGAIWVLEDAGAGRLLKLSPVYASSPAAG